MNRRLFLIMLCTMFVWTLCAQNIFDDPDTLKNDIIKVNYQRKNAKLAMLMSAILPGAGQYYADKKSITTYIFPIIEAGLIYGYIDYTNKGHDLEHKYQKYATGETITIKNNDDVVIYTGPRYNTIFQFGYLNSSSVLIQGLQQNLAGIYTDDIYDNIYFKWNPQNMEFNQHFYEDIGKYNKYIFGWADWYQVYAYNGQGTIDWQNASFVPVPNAPNWAWNSNHTIWLGNYPTNPENIIPGQSYDEPYSALRAKYINMRKDAEVKFDKATDINFAIVMNHLVSSLDAIRVTHKFNRNYLSQNEMHFNYRTTLYNSHFTPMLTFCKEF